MKNTKLHDVLNDLWGTRILNLEFDILKNRIILDIESLDAGIIHEQRVELLDVSSYYFVNNTGVSRKSFIPYEEGDFLELTSIVLFDENVDIRTVTGEKWIEQYYSKTNIAIEIWSRYLFVEAKILVVGDIELQLTT